MDDYLPANIDFGLNDLDFGLETGKKKEKKSYDPKDPYGMNNLSEELKAEVSDTIMGFKKDIEGFKKDYNDIKSEIKPIRDFFAKRKAEKQVKNIIAFGQCMQVKLRPEYYTQGPKIHK